MTKKLSKHYLLTPDEVSQMLQIKKRSLYHLIARRKIAFYKIGRLLRFSRDDIQNYLEQTRIKMIIK